MQNLSTWTSGMANSPIARNTRITHRGALLAANSRAQSEIGPEPISSQPDPRGQTLRLLRQQHNWDPAVLATQACISLRQLYQLETGEDSLFYNTGLRNQAGRRVARILGVQWEDLGQLPVPALADKPLKVVSLHGTDAATGAALPVASAPDAQDPPLGLNREATETLTLPTPATARTQNHEQKTDPAEPARKSNWLLTLTVWSLVAGLGAATGWALAEHWGVRFSVEDLLRPFL